MDTELDFAQQLEQESLQFLQVVGEPDKEYESQRLANVLIGKSIAQSKQVLQIKKSGNFGLALNSIIQNNLATSQQASVVVALMSYWALTNHIEKEEVALLLFNRALLMSAHKEIFVAVYKQAVSQKHNPHSIDYSVSMAGADNTIYNMFTYDMFMIHTELPFAKEIYNQFSKTYGISPEKFRLPFFYTDNHSLMKDQVRLAFSKGNQ